MRKTIVGVVFFALLCSGIYRAWDAFFSTPTIADSQDYSAERRNHSTKLLVKSSAPQKWTSLAPPKDVLEIEYLSGELKLKAWYALPKGASKEHPVPAVVYYHGGYAFVEDDFMVCSPFLDAGFAVMTPILRAENGNPGNFEMFYGEVDDARSALKWISKQPEINQKRLYTFGHSAGGCISTLVAFDPGTPLRLTGNVGGMWPEEKLREQYKRGFPMPFDASDSNEFRLRTPANFIGSLKIPHVAYYGTDDYYAVQGAELAVARATKIGAPLRGIAVNGDHEASLHASIPLFLKEVQADVEKP